MAAVYKYDTTNTYRKKLTSNFWTENTHSATRYNYCNNSPIIIIDPNGEEIINAHAKDKALAETRQQKAQASFDAFGGNKNADGYRAAKKELNKANSSLRSETRDYNIVNKAMSDVKTNNESYYNAMDNLKDQNGNTVDIYVSAQNLGGNGQGGRTTAKYDYGTNSFADNMISIALNTYPGYAAQDVGTLLSHELGHVECFVTDSKRYFNWLKSTIPPGVPHNGHNFDDPSGKNADRRENQYKEILKKKTNP